MPCSPADLANTGVLLIPDQAGDTGARPFADGDNEVYYLSPSIVLSGGVDAGTAKVGAPNTVSVTVKNISGQALQDVNVEAWVCDFTMGVDPASALASSNPGGAPMTGFFAGPLPPGASQAIAVSPVWTPTVSDAALNGGHVCIAANCFADPPDKGMTLAAEGNAFKFLCDTHHAQRNIHVQVVQGGMRRFDFHMVVTNPQPRLGTVTHAMMAMQTGPRALIGLAHVLRFHPGIVAATVLPHVAITGHPNQTFAADALHIESHPSPAAIVADHAIDNRFFLPINAQTHIPLRLSATPPKSFAIASDAVGHGTNLNFNLRVGQKKTMTVSVDLGDATRPGDTHVFDLVQRAASGQILGGARIITIVHP
jgi:hypothetical protein